MRWEDCWCGWDWEVRSHLTSLGSTHPVDNIDCYLLLDNRLSKRGQLDKKQGVLPSFQRGIWLQIAFKQRRLPLFGSFSTSDIENIIQFTKILDMLSFSMKCCVKMLNRSSVNVSHPPPPPTPRKFLGKSGLVFHPRELRSSCLEIRLGPPSGPDASVAPKQKLYAPRIAWPF